ncbi:TPA: DNA sulfur modification protein DndE [Enterobacter cloacae]
MLPNRMQLGRQTEEQLKKLKIFTGLTPNVTARIAFFRSIESQFRYNNNEIEKNLDGSLVLDKITWLGETMNVTELLLKMLYPKMTSKQLQRAWAAHVEDGISSLRNHKNIKDFLLSI